MPPEVDETEETDVTETDTEAGSEEETDDSTTETTETSDDTGDGSEESVEQYLDIKSVPPNLTEMAKRMQASHTKKMMAAEKKAEEKVGKLIEKREAELSDKYTTYIARANALAELAKHPDFSLWYDDLVNGRPYGSSSQNGKGKVSDDDGEAGETVANMTVEQLAKRLLPAMKVISERSVKPLIDAKASEQIEDAKGKLLNFGKHKAEILRLMSERGLGVHEAHKLAAHDDLIAAAKADAVKGATTTAKTIPKKSETGNAAKGGSPVLSDKTKRTLRESINHAIHTLKAG